MSLRSGSQPQAKGQNWQTKKSDGSYAHSLLPTQETGPSSFPVVFLDTSLHYCHGGITQQILQLMPEFYCSLIACSGLRLLDFGLFGL